MQVLFEYLSLHDHSFLSFIDYYQLAKENEINNKKIAEENTTLNFLGNRRNSKRTIKLNSKFTGDDWINK